jgi:excisionase family DNA binding protein
MPIQIYTKKEAATVLKVSEKTIDRLVLKGKLNSTKIGGLRRFTEQQLNRLIREGESNL